jgi:hypothetical protein
MVVSYKASHATAIIFLIYCAPLLITISNHSRFIHQSSLLWLQQRHLVAKWEETGQEMAATSFTVIPQGILNIPTWEWQLYFPPKEVMLRIFDVLKYPSPSAGFEPANFGFNGNVTPPRTIKCKHKNSDWLESMHEVTSGGFSRNDVSLRPSFA